MMLPAEEREDRAIENFLNYYNQTNGTSYRPERPKDKRIDFICKDDVTGAEIVIECTTLADPKWLELEDKTRKILAKVEYRLRCKLPGVFLLWAKEQIKYADNAKEALITQLCKEIEKTASNLAEGEEAQIDQPFDMTLVKEEARKVRTECALITHPPGGKYPLPKRMEQRIRAQFEVALSEANKKFANYTHMSTILLVNIWETVRDYETLKGDMFQSIDMGKYPNIKHIYLSEGLPDPPIYHLWPRSA